MVKELEQKLEESQELFGKFDKELNIMKNNKSWVKEPCFIEVMNGIKAIYLQNEIILKFYLQEIYKNQSEVKK